MFDMNLNHPVDQFPIVTRLSGCSRLFSNLNNTTRRINNTIRYGLLLNKMLA